MEDEEKRLSGIVDRRLAGQIKSLESILSELIRSEFQTFSADVLTMLGETRTKVAEHETRIVALEVKKNEGVVRRYAPCFGCAVAAGLVIYLLLFLK